MNINERKHQIAAWPFCQFMNGLCSEDW